MNRKISVVLISSMLYFLTITALFSQVNTLPLIQISDLEYQGAFIIPSDEFGESSANYSTGTIEYNKVNESIFLSGFNLDGSIAEFSIPTLVNSTDLLDLNSSVILQDFRKILNLTSDNNPQSINRISGMRLINDQLIVNAVEFYDAPADNTHTTVILDNPSNLSTSTVSDYYALDGAAHAAGWISPIPTEWQAVLEGDYISGNSSKYAINARQAMGVSAFVFNASDLNGLPSVTIPTTPLLDFNLSNPIYADYTTYEDANYNLIEVNGDTPPGHTLADADIVKGENDLWTEISQASYGFIIPESSTYLSIGSSGGHNSGVGYKPTQNNGNLCPGPCPYDAEDYYNYYWLWDVNDLVSVKNGSMQAYDLRPYAYGIFDAPFQVDAYTNTPEFHPITGGTFDPISGLLYLSIYDGAPINSPYTKTPVIAAYKINTPLVSTTQEDVSNVRISPNPASDFISISAEKNTIKKVMIYNQLGELITEATTDKIDVSDLMKGIYFVNTVLQNGEIIGSKLIVE